MPGLPDFETEVMPTIIDQYVRTGKLKVIARPVAIIGSARLGDAAGSA